MSHDVFISYAHEDLQIATDICDALEDKGISCFYAPRDIEYGEYWAKELVEALKIVSVLVLVYSEKCNISKHITRELCLAVQAGLIIIPFKVEDADPQGELLYWINNTHWLSALPSPYTGHIQKLVNAVSHWLESIETGNLPQAEMEYWEKSMARYVTNSTCILSSVMPRIPLKNFLFALSPKLEPSKNLQPFRCFLEFIGREHELSELFKFRDSTDRFEWMVITGEGGVGKTRLAMEYINRSIDFGWHSGFIDDISLKQFVDRERFDKWFPLRSTLIVVDYAANKRSNLLKLMYRCYSLLSNAYPLDSKHSPKVRIIMLERHAQPGNGWLNELLQSGEADVRDYIETSFQGVMNLLPPGIDTKEDPYTTTVLFLKSAFKAWGKLTQKEAPAFPEFSDLDLWQIKSNTGNKPLLLQMAAINACETGNAKALPQWGRSKILLEAVARERWYVKSACKENKCPDGFVEIIETCTAVLCIAGMKDFSDGKLSSLLKVLVAFSDYPQIQVGDIKKQWLALFKLELENSEGSESTPIAPDILAEAFAYQVLQRGDAVPEQYLRLALDLTGVIAWTRLIRLVQDLDGITGFEHVSQCLFQIIEGRAYDELIEVAKILPERTVSHRQFAIKLFRNLLDHWDATQMSREERVWLMIELGMHIDEGEIEGGKQEALALSQQAVEEAKSFALTESDVSLVLLARAYHYLGRQSSNTDRLGADKQAVEIRRTLAQRNWSKYGALLGYSLNNLGNEYHELGLYQEALDAAQESVKIAQGFAVQNSLLYNSDLARSLNCLSLRLLALGRLDEAHEAARKSVDLRQSLTHINPDEYAPALDLSLGTLKVIQNSLGLKSELVRTLHRRIMLYDDLTSRNRELYQQRLYVALMEGIGIASETGSVPDLDKFTEMTAVLCQSASDSMLQSYASVFEYSSYAIADNGDLDKGYQILKKAIDLRETILSRTNAENAVALDREFRRIHADYISAAKMLAGLGNLKESNDCMFAGLQTLSRCIKTDNVEELSSLADSYRSLGFEYDKIGVKEKGIEATQKSIQIYERLPGAVQSEKIWDIIMAYNNLVQMMVDIGKAAEARDSADKVYTFLTALTQEEKEAQILWFGQFNDTLACAYLALNELDKACVAGSNAVQAYEHMDEEIAKKRYHEYSIVSNNHGKCLIAVGRYESAQAVIENSIELLGHIDEAERHPLHNNLLEEGKALYNLACMKKDGEQDKSGLDS